VELVVFLGTVILAERAEAYSTQRDIPDDDVLIFPVIGKVDAFAEKSRLLPGMLPEFEADIEKLITTAFDFQLPFSIFLVLRDGQVFCLSTEWADNNCYIALFDQKFSRFHSAFPRSARQFKRHETSYSTCFRTFNPRPSLLHENVKRYGNLPYDKTHIKFFLKKYSLPL
jgi:hypothetical protein